VSLDRSAAATIEEPRLALAPSLVARAALVLLCRIPRVGRSLVAKAALVLLCRIARVGRSSLGALAVLLLFEG
jgi:hypothetical protein